jgi:hypothetical protein
LLGEGEGSIGIGKVYALLAPHFPSASVIIPMLVGKVPRRSMLSRVAHEARAYEKLEHLQGVATPRYHGLFKAQIPGRCSVLGLDEDGNDPHEPSPDETSHPFFVPLFKKGRRVFIILLPERLSGLSPMLGKVTDTFRAFTLITLQG